jgi:CubicO group peptidase (beta-lactamase class C family)
VTIRRLLDHTSGIPGYTEMPEFGPISVRTLPRDSLVALFSAKPFGFAPGEAEVYSNSAYFLLGLVIEKVSGLSYEKYVQQNLFDRAGMPDSRYCSNTAVVLRRTHGYDYAAGRLQLASYVDFTWPYSGGSLCSTVGDLVAWVRAMHGGTLLGSAAYRELITPGTLNDGTRLRYAKGLAIDSILGHRVINHDGGIPGFFTELAYFPDDSLTIAVLINTAGPVNPTRIAQSIVSLVLGDRSQKPLAFGGRSADYAGEYRGVGRGREMVLKIAADTANGLTVAIRGGPATRLDYYGGETFGSGRLRYIFVRDAGRVTKLRLDFLAANVLTSRQGGGGEQATAH